MKGINVVFLKEGRVIVGLVFKMLISGFMGNFMDERICFENVVNIFKGGI